MPMMAVQSVSACRPAHWKALYGHILLSGGTGCLAGLRFRLQREITALVSPALTVKVWPSCPPWPPGSPASPHRTCGQHRFQ